MEKYLNKGDTLENQAYVFFIFILNGFLIGIVFDVFRIFRKAIKTSDIVTYIQDIRGYVFLGIIIGYLIYFLLFSKTLIKINLYFINLIKKVLYYLLFLPIKKTFLFTKKIFFKPIIINYI